MRPPESLSSYTSHRRGDDTRLLVAGPRPAITTLARLGEFLAPSDLLVVNESGTLPASLPATLERSGEAFELRLAAREGAESDLWLAVAFGAGSWREPTEERGPPPELHAGDRLRISPTLRARVRRRDGRHARLLHLRLEGDPAELYRVGLPVQYSYHRDPLTLWDIQTPLAGAPWSVEPPSALFPLTAARLLELRRRHRVVPILHGAGLSSTGDPALDALLPLPEPFRVPQATWRAVRETKAAGGRVVAWGTSAARALEAAFESGASEGLATVRLGRDRPARVVDALLTGFHEPITSHYALEEAFVPPAILARAYRMGRRAGLVGHEYGDLTLLFRSGENETV